MYIYIHTIAIYIYILHFRQLFSSGTTAVIVSIRAFVSLLRREIWMRLTTLCGFIWDDGSKHQGVSVSQMTWRQRSDGLNIGTIRKIWMVVSNMFSNGLKPATRNGVYSGEGWILWVCNVQVFCFCDIFWVLSGVEKCTWGVTGSIYYVTVNTSWVI